MWEIILLGLIYLGLIIVVGIDLKTTFVDLRLVLGIWVAELIYVLLTDQFSEYIWKEVIILAVIGGFYLTKLFYLGDCFFALIMPILYLNQTPINMIINLLAAIFFLSLILGVASQKLKIKEVPATPFLLLGSMMHIL